MAEGTTLTTQPVSLLRPGDTAFCPSYHQAAEIIGRRWVGAILRSLLAGTTRFTEISAAWPGMSHRVLSQRLKELEDEGIVSRTVHDRTPVQITYRLTTKGEALSEVVNALSSWADHWLGDATIEST
jgi:DNA-binding HxlR family transcriptional regulator